MDSKKDISNQNILFNDTNDVVSFISSQSTCLKIQVNFDLSSTWDLYNFL